MADGFSWSEMRGGGAYRLPGPEHLGWWAAVAMLISILLHVAVFFALDQMKIALSFEQAREINTQAVNIRQVEVKPMDIEETAPPENVVVPPNDTAKLLDEIDLLKELPKNLDIDIKPDIQKAEYALQMKNPAAEGDPAAVAMEAAAGFDMEADLPELGRQPEQLRPAEIGQATVDPGALQGEDSEIGKFTDDILKKGANGHVEKGALDGIASLDDLLDLPPSILLGKKTMLPSDLLFEFNSSELRENAKVGLMKLALLMDQNPDLFCWIEGHTDLVGGDEFNLNLSIKRAESVKAYLVNSMRMDASKIITRGFGRYEPLVITGSADEQAVNRRVEIRMRKTPPTKEQMRIAPQKAPIIEPAPAAPPAVQEAPPPPKALMVKPQRALPVEDAPALPRAEPVPPRAAPVEDDIEPLPDVPKATPVSPPVQKALPVGG